jgi:hypothetical protein
MFANSRRLIKPQSKSRFRFLSETLRTQRGARGLSCGDLYFLPMA